MRSSLFNSLHKKSPVKNKLIDIIDDKSINTKLFWINSLKRNIVIKYVNINAKVAEITWKIILLFGLIPKLKEKYR